MAESNLGKILSLVDVVGSEANLKKYRSTVDVVLPKCILNKDRYWYMYAKISSEFINSPYVKDKQSVITCMFNAVKLGLNPDPVFGEIYFVPYAGKLTYQIGYKGMIKMSLNTGYVVDVRSGLVFEKDEWDYWEDENGQHYKIRPAFGVANRGRELFGYSIFEKRDGKSHIHTMETEHIEKIKALVLSRMKGGKTPWSDAIGEPEMRKKTVIRRHWKTEPKSEEIANAIEYEESIERGEILKQQHPELEGIIDEIIEKNQNQEHEENVLPVFDEPKATI